MKKKQILVLSVALLALVGCGNKPTSSSTSSEATTSETPVTSEGTTTSGQTTTETGTTTSSSSSSSSSSSMNQTAALALFREALKKDYSNVSLKSTQYYDDNFFGGEMEEIAYEYVVGNDITVHDYSKEQEGYDREDCYLFYHIDEQKKSWMYFEADSDNPDSKGGWLNKGYENADLSIWETYFYLPLLLDNISENDINYFNGLYFVEDIAKIDELNYSAFGYAWFNDINNIAFSISSTGYIDQIYGFCDSITNPINFVYIELFNFGSTTMPAAFNEVVPCSEATKIGYWEYKGWPHDYQQAYYTEIHAKLSDGQELASDETHDVVVDIDKKFNVEYSTIPEEFQKWDIVDDKDKVVTWHYDKTILEETYSYKSQTKTFRSIAGGETEIYVTVNSAEGTIESEHIRVKVNELKEQDKEGVLYDFVFAGLQKQGAGADTYYDVLATNAVEDSKGLYTITAGPGVGTNDGKNGESNYFKNGQQYLYLAPSSNDVMNKTRGADLYFDFGEQQVSKISFNYGLFWADHKQNLKDVLSSFMIRTYNTEGDVVEHEMKDVIKENISAEFVKNYEYEFAPASKVEIVAKAGTLGRNMSIFVDSFCFSANDDCHMYIPLEDIEVESITLTGNTDIYVDRTTQLNAIVNPQNAYDKSLTWHIEDGKEGVVSVENGLVTGLSAGTAEVWVTASNGVESNKLTITVTEMPSFEAYLGNKYKNSYNYLVEIVDAHNAKFTMNSTVIEATIIDFDGDKYYLENEQGEGFTLSFGRSYVNISGLKYMSNGELNTSSTATYSCDLLQKVTSFSVSVNSKTPNSDGKYDVKVGETATVKANLTPSDSASDAKITYKSSDETKATVENTGYVQFKDSGEVTITVTVKDEYGYEDSKSVTFVVAKKIYPNNDNWSISYNRVGEEIKVGNQVQFFVDSWDENINTDSTVTWSTSDTDIATISNASDSKGLLTAKAEGEVTVYAQVTGENGKITKEITITIGEAAEGMLPDTVTGMWNDSSNDEFTFEVNPDGTAVMTIYGEEEVYFTYDRMHGSYYVFVCDDDPEIELELWVKSNTEASLGPVDRDNTFIGESYLFMPGSGVDVERQL